MTNSEPVVVQPMQWSNVADIQDVAPVSEADAPVLRELRDVLRRHGALGRFGVTLIHSHFDVGPGEVLLESVDMDARILTVRPTPSAALGTTIQTSWRFSESDSAENPSLHCPVHCPLRPGTTEHMGVRHSKFPVA